MLTIHHLTTSQSERVVWLCEELAIPYKLVVHERLPGTRLAPPSLRNLTPMGTGPVMEDGDIVMSESGAIVEYIIHKHGGGRLALKPDHPDYAQYLFWFHWANASLQPVMGRNMVINRLGIKREENAFAKGTWNRLERALNFLDARLEKNQWLAGEEFTAADIMTVFSLTTMRVFMPVELEPYLYIVGYVEGVDRRPAYKQAIKKSATQTPQMLGAR
jgi:glutathione S-transferase